MRKLWREDLMYGSWGTSWMLGLSGTAWLESDYPVLGAALLFLAALGFLVVLWTFLDRSGEQTEELQERDMQVRVSPLPKPKRRHPQASARTSARARHPVARLRPIANTAHCPYCRDGLEGVTHACGECGVTHHEECLLEMRGCTTLGCANTPQRWREVAQ